MRPFFALFLFLLWCIPQWCIVPTATASGYSLGTSGVAVHGFSHGDVPFDRAGAVREDSVETGQMPAEQASLALTRPGVSGLATGFGSGPAIASMSYVSLSATFGSSVEGDLVFAHSGSPGTTLSGWVEITPGHEGVPGISIISGLGPFALSAGQNYNVTVRCSPSQPFAHTALLIYHNGGNEPNPLSVPVYCNGYYPPPELSAPSNGASSVSTNPTLTWTGAAGAYIAELASDPEFSDDVQGFPLSSSTSWQVSGLEHGKTYYWHVMPYPGPWSETWSFTTEVPLGPQISVDPLSIDFDIVTTGQFNYKNLTIANDGGSVLEGTLSFTGGVFGTTVSGPPDLEFSIAAGGSFVRSLFCYGGKEGVTEGTLVITHNAGDPVEVQLTCEGRPFPKIGADKTSLDFGELGVGQADTLTVMIWNAGPEESVLNPYVTLSGSADFSIVGQMDSRDLFRGSYTGVRLRCAPTTTGTKTTILTIHHGSYVPVVDPVSIPVTCNESPPVDEPVLSVDPESLPFGTVQLGSSAQQVLTISNAGGGQLSGTARVTGDGGGFFSITGIVGDVQSFGPLSSQQSAQVTVKCTPSTYETREGYVQVTEAGSENSVLIPLTCTGDFTEPPQTPGIVVSASTLPFGAVGVGHEVQQLLTITNYGQGTLSGQVSLASGTAGFSITSGSGAYSLTSGQRKVVAVQFKPTSVGTKTDSLSITHNAPSLPNPVAVPLTGEAKDKTLTAYRYYYERDHLGSVRATVNENGAMVHYADYYPFGLQMPLRVSTGEGPKERFTGHELDELSEAFEDVLYYAGARYLDPVIGRWRSVDPLADAYPGWSSYSYVFNSPIRFVDPSGLCPEGGGGVDEDGVPCLEEIYIEDWRYGPEYVITYPFRLAARAAFAALQGADKVVGLSDAVNSLREIPTYLNDGYNNVREGNFDDLLCNVINTAEGIGNIAGVIETGATAVSLVSAPTLVGPAAGETIAIGANTAALWADGASLVAKSIQVFRGDRHWGSVAAHAAFSGASYFTPGLRVQGTVRQLVVDAVQGYVFGLPQEILEGIEHDPCSGR